MRRALVVGVVVLAAAAVWRGDTLLATLRSPKALAVIVGVTVVAVLIGRFVRPAPLRWVLRGVLIAVVGSTLILPLFRETRIEEDLPGVAVGGVPTTTAVTETTSEAAAPTSSTAPVGPQRLSTGMLVGIDHGASGAASVYQVGDDQFIVRLEDVDIQPGPDYDVWLVPGLDQQKPGDGVKLDDLKATKGSHNYPVPDSFEVRQALTVLIWCESFDVPVANASQS